MMNKTEETAKSPKTWENFWSESEESCESTNTFIEPIDPSLS